jgi:hypothetical protein
MEYRNVWSYLWYSQMLYVREHDCETFDSIVREFIDQLDIEVSLSMNTSIQYMGLLVREQNGTTRILVEHGTVVQPK